MKTILVTGGTGSLGSQLVSRLQKTDNRVRIMSRSKAKTPLAPNMEWVQADLITQDGLAEAVQGVDTIIHCASVAFKDTHAVDILGTEKMLQLAKAAGVQHVFYVSIVGIDRIPFKYYRYKLDAEKVIEASGIPYTILRITQFHTLLELALKALTKVRWLPVLPLPTNFKFQLIDTGDVADYMLPYVLGEPAGRLEDLGGLEVLTVGEIAREWKKVQHERRPILPIPIFGASAKGFREGYNTVPEHKYGTVTWRDYLQQKYGRASAAKKSVSQPPQQESATS